MAVGAMTMVALSSQADHSLVRRLRQGGLWTFSGRTTGMAMVMATHIVLARIMPTAEFATFVLASSVVVFFSRAAMFGLNTLVCRYLAESFGVKDPERARHALRWTVRIGAVSIASMGLVGWWLLHLLGDGLFHLPGLRESAGLIALWIMLLAISQILAEIFRGLHDLGMASILGGVSGGLASSTLFLLGIGLTSLLIPIGFAEVALVAAASLVLPSIYAVILLRRRWPRDAYSPPARPKHGLAPLTLASVTRETFPMMLVQVLSFGLAQLDIWIVGACCSDVELAYYGVARRLAFLVAIPLTQVNLVVASTISELHAQGDRGKLESVIRGAATVSAILTSAIFIVLASFPTAILDVTFGPTFYLAAGPLLILCWGQLIFAFTGPCGLTLMMTGHQCLSLWSLIATTFLFLFAPWAAAKYGLEAVALISALAISIHSIIQWVTVRVLLRIGTHPCWRPEYVASILSSLFRKVAA